MNHDDRYILFSCFGSERYDAIEAGFFDFGRGVRIIRHCMRMTESGPY